MCGLNGIFSKRSIINIAKRLDAMNSALRHRGPNFGQTQVFNDKAALGHRRLSIIDISDKANQPMQANSGRYWIVFNGEIYNFKEIKEQIKEYQYRTYSDTEVILAALETYGLPWFLAIANGMFAIAIFDLKQNQIYLVRDRFGIKPLYYILSNELLIFSSEIKGILASGLHEPSLNQAAIDDYLGYRYVREPYSFFENIYQVPSAHYLLIDNDLKLTQHRYWQLPTEFNCATNYDETKILEQFNNKLSHAIDLRLIADVPIGAYLSGGVDSSLISAIAATKHPQLITYAIGFDELNEFHFSRMVAEQYTLNYHQIQIDSKSYLDLDNWCKLISYKDAPLGVPNEIPLSILSKELKKNITVVLSGEGADELMGGYGRIYRLGFEYLNRNNQQNYQQSFFNYFSQKYEYVDRETRDAYLKINSNYRLNFDADICKRYTALSHEEFIFRFFHDYHIKGLLQRLDATTMCYSIEGRVPFLDYKLVEFAYKEIPYELKLKWHSPQAKLQAQTLAVDQISEKLDTPKYLLKKLSEKYLPKEIIYRKKMGFPVPLNNWYHDLSLLGRQILNQADWLQSNSYLKLAEELNVNPRAGQLLWMFINIELFISTYFSKTYKW